MEDVDEFLQEPKGEGTGAYGGIDGLTLLDGLDKSLTLGFREVRFFFRTAQKPTQLRLVCRHLPGCEAGS
jgi:hypothetical protein